MRDSDKILDELEKRISFQEIYKQDPDLFNDIINNVDFENVSDAGYIDYEKLKKEYEKSVGFGTPQNMFDLWILGQKGYGADTDWYELEDKPVYYWEKYFGVPRWVCLMMRSLADLNSLRYINVEGISFEKLLKSMIKQGLFQ